MYVHTYTYINMYVHTYTYIHGAYTFPRPCGGIYLYLYISISNYTDIDTYIHMYICMYACISLYLTIQI